MAVIVNNGLIVKEVYIRGEITHLKSNLNQRLSFHVFLFHMYHVEIKMNETSRALRKKPLFSMTSQEL